VVNFKNTIIIMTSNIGSYIIQENFEHLEKKDVDTVVEKTQREVMELLRKTVRPVFPEAITVLSWVASKRDLTARQGARTAHSLWPCKGRATPKGCERPLRRPKGNAG
jgi:hypothetical protein